MGKREYNNTRKRFSPLTTAEQIQQHYDDIEALYLAIQEKYRQIARLRQQKGKVKTGVGQRAVIELQLKEAKKKMKAI